MISSLMIFVHYHFLSFFYHCLVLCRNEFKEKIPLEELFKRKKNDFIVINFLLQSLRNFLFTPFLSFYNFLMYT